MGRGGARNTSDVKGGVDDEKEMTTPLGRLDLRVPLRIITAASIVEFIAGAIECNGMGCAQGDGDNYVKWSVAAGVFPAFIALIILLADHFFGSKMSTEGHFGVATFLFLWWAVAAGINTFKSPFREPGNGYFASWVAFAGTMLYLGAAATRFWAKNKERRDRKKRQTPQQQVSWGQQPMQGGIQQPQQPGMWEPQPGMQPGMMQPGMMRPGMQPGMQSGVQHVGGGQVTVTSSQTPKPQPTELAPAGPPPMSGPQISYGGGPGQHGQGQMMGPGNV